MNYKKIITLIILLFIRIDKVISIDINEINNFDDEFENIFNEEKPTIRKLAHYDALSILTAIKFPSAIYGNIYTQTYPIAERSIFSFPSMLLYHSEHVPSLECLSNLWRFNLFFNQSLVLISFYKFPVKNMSNLNNSKNQFFFTKQKSKFTSFTGVVKP